MDVQLKYELLIAVLRTGAWAGLACLATLLLYRGGAGTTARGFFLRAGITACLLMLTGLLLALSGLYGPVGIVAALAILAVGSAWQRARRTSGEGKAPSLPSWLRGRFSALTVGLVGLLERLEQDPGSHLRLARRRLRRVFLAPHASRRRRLFTVLLVACAAPLLRFWSLASQPMSVTASWFGAVQKVKDLRLQTVLGDVHQLPGYHALVRVFSDLTQTRVEFMLLISEGLAALLGSLLIYRLVRRLLGSGLGEEEAFSRSAHYGGLAAASVWALAPLLVAGEAYTHNMYYTQLVLGLALGACALLLLRGEEEARAVPPGPARILLPAMVLATSLTDLMAFGLLLAGGAFCLLEHLATKPFRRDRGESGTGRRLLLFGAGALLSAASYAAMVQGYGMAYREFFLSQLFHPEVYFGDFGFTVLQQRLLWGILGAGVFCCIARAAARIWNGGVRAFSAAECIFYLAFLALALLNRLAPALREEWTSLPQVPMLLSLAAAAAAGLVVRHLVHAGSLTLSRAAAAPRDVLRWMPRTFLAAVVLVPLLSGLRPTGVPAEQPPDALPRNFYQAFHRISSERIPTSYSIIAPAVMRPLTVNRSRFLDYPFFLQNYARLDSLYRRTKAQGGGMPGAELQYEYRPSPHVFLFIAKPPYDFQQSNIPHLQERMSAMRRWVKNFRARGGSAEVYYESPQSVVYQLNYETGYALINESLYRTHSDKPWPILAE
ncbi:MAG: hypothetical protein U5K31_00710 [Balneolaceae bacterium]|nr:hypothetical protein [Balneolaceae bacterium]